MRNSLVTLRQFCSRMVAAAVLVFIFSCSEKDEPAPPVKKDNLVEAVVTGGRTAQELKYLVQLSGSNIDPALIAYDVDVYNVVYTTTYRDKEIAASGLVLIPRTTNTLPMVSFQHGTLVRAAEAPSLQSKSSVEVISYAALASLGFITAVPDYIGFGTSADVFHPYYVAEPTTAAVIDLLTAAAALAKEKKTAFSGELFLAGYSEGGYATLATHKALETNPVESLTLVASFSGAGGYDITAMQDYLFGLETYSQPYYLSYVGLSYQSYYDQPDVIENFFNEPYASRIPELFDGVTSAADINAQLTTDISALIRPEVRGNSGDASDKFLREKFEENALVDWAPSLPAFLYHGDLDTTVPLENSERTYDALLANGASAETLHFIVLPGKDHSSAVEPFIEDVIAKLDALR